MGGVEPSNGAPSAQSGLSGLRLLHDPKDAFAARLWLIRSARRTLDVQYYIWHDDLSRSLLLDEFVAAARRGVSVRLLIDDNGIGGLDARLALLDSEPTVTVRLYNPFKMRRLQALEWLFAFRRLNSRMHAKSLTADRHATIVGGRNIGDEYFGAQSKGQFDDLDVIARGPVAAEVEHVFEHHWESDGRVPLPPWSAAFPPERCAEPRGRRRPWREAPQQRGFSQPPKPSRYLPTYNTGG